MEPGPCRFGHAPSQAQSSHAWPATPGQPNVARHAEMTGRSRAGIKTKQAAAVCLHRQKIKACVFANLRIAWPCQSAGLTATADLTTRMLLWKVFGTYSRACLALPPQRRQSHLSCRMLADLAAQLRRPPTRPSASCPPICLLPRPPARQLVSIPPKCSKEMTIAKPVRR